MGSAYFKFNDWILPHGYHNKKNVEERMLNGHLSTTNTALNI